MGIARGITDQGNRDGPELLSSVNPTFTWVRLAQRIPVRIRLTQVPERVLVSAGMTCRVIMKDGMQPIAASMKYLIATLVLTVGQRWWCSDALRRVFEGVVAKCIAAGLVGGRGIFIDALPDQGSRAQERSGCLAISRLPGRRPRRQPVRSPNCPKGKLAFASAPSASSAALLGTGRGGREPSRRLSSQTGYAGPQSCCSGSAPDPLSLTLLTVVTVFSGNERIRITLLPARPSRLNAISIPLLLGRRRVSSGL